CRSLFLGGVTRRFPELKFAFLEGGVAWACQLYADIIGHWEKRNRKALENYDPTLLDRGLFEKLYAKYGSEVLRKRLETPIYDEIHILTDSEDPTTLDEWVACEIESADDIRELFASSFYFGCEADDPMTSAAFNTRVNPQGARLSAGGSRPDRLPRHHQTGKDAADTARNGRDHAAGAGIFEAGYMLPDVVAKPWLRAGINVASGGDPTEDHNTFFNLMPTNHLYYGFADQLAFQNLMDVIVQLKLKLHEKVGLNLMYHHFRLHDHVHQDVIVQLKLKLHEKEGLNLMYHHFRLLNDDDGQYFGTGAFSKQGNKPGAFGYGAIPAATHGFNKDVGDEIDIVVDWKLHKHVALQGGYAYLWGGDVRETAFPNEPDVQFGYVQVHFKY
ncbi:hypothetical protein CEE37_12065, partial [candidate division LCP-89 bacterium B3_LCP]